VSTTTPAKHAVAATGTAPTGPGLGGLVAAHLIGLRTRGTYVLLGLSVLVPVAATVVLLLVGQQVFDITGAELARAWTDPIGNELFAVLIGIFVAGTAHRHGTIVPVLLVEPRRVRIAASAVLVAAGVTLAVTVVAALIAAAVALPWLGSQGVPIGEVLADPDLWMRVGGQTAVTTLMAVFGAALAVLLRGVLGAVLTYLGVTFLEGVAVGIWPQWEGWGPFSAFITLRDLGAAEPPTPIWVAALIAGGFLAAVVAAALVTTARRDAA
jgi:hypothetical protein